MINAKTAPSVIGPYSQAIKFDNLIFVSGQIAINPVSNEFVNGNIISQTKQVIENISAALESAGSSLKKALKVTIYITDMKDFNNINMAFILNILALFYQHGFVSRCPICQKEQKLKWKPLQVID